MVLHGKIISNRDELTKQILSGESVNIDGYEISKSLYQSAKNINLNQFEKKFSGKCQIVQISRKEQSLKKNIEQLASLYKTDYIEVVVEQQFWKEIKDYTQCSNELNNSLLKCFMKKENE